VTPFFLRWLPVAVIVEVDVENHQMAMSVTT
jgi:hypothetical protein